MVDPKRVVRMVPPSNSTLWKLSRVNLPGHSLVRGSDRPKRSLAFGVEANVVTPNVACLDCPGVECPAVGALGLGGKYLLNNLLQELVFIATVSAPIDAALVGVVVIAGEYRVANSNRVL